MSTPIDGRCPYCGSAMTVSRMSCSVCQVNVGARFPAPRLARLPIEHQRFIELFVLSGGSLKEIAERAGVSYPTVRSRLDRVVGALKREIEQSATVPAGETTTQEFARVIKAI